MTVWHDEPKILIGLFSSSFSVVVLVSHHVNKLGMIIPVTLSLQPSAWHISKPNQKSQLPREPDEIFHIHICELNKGLVF